MKNFRTEDWVVTILSIPLLIISIFSTKLPNDGIKIPSSLDTLDAWLSIGIFFVIALSLLYIGNRWLNRPLRGILRSFTVIFIVAVFAQWMATLPQIKAYGFEAVFFSVLFGLLIRNLFSIPDWLKPAIQGEFFIKIGVVCLGATVLFSDVMKSGAAGLIQAFLVVTIVWLFGYWLSRRNGVERNSAMTLASGCAICGVSACITAAGVTGADKRSLSYLTSLVLIIVVPMIYIMPWLAEMVVPLFTDDPTIQSEITGAWIGGTIDTTSGVTASSEMAGKVAQDTAIVVKGTQNVLIGFVAFFMALYLSSRSNKRGEGGSTVPSLGIVWDKFPKFILGFVLASALFSILQNEDLLSLASKGKFVETSMAKNFSTFFFSLSFVCIGMDTRLKDIISKENRNMLKSFIGAQLFNIVVACLIAWLMFGVVKPALWPNEHRGVSKIEMASAHQVVGVDNMTVVPKA